MHWSSTFSYCSSRLADQPFRALGVQSSCDICGCRAGRGTGTARSLRAPSRTDVQASEERRKQQHTRAFSRQPHICAASRPHACRNLGARVRTSALPYDPPSPTPAPYPRCPQPPPPAAAALIAHWCVRACMCVPAREGVQGVQVRPSEAQDFHQVLGGQWHACSAMWRHIGGGGGGGGLGGG